MRGRDGARRCGRRVRSGARGRRTAIVVVLAVAATLAVSAPTSGRRDAEQTTWVRTQLPGLCGRPGSWCGAAAWAINDRGQIVGHANTKADVGSSSHAVIWDKGRIRDLGALRSGSSVAYDINERAQVVGWSYIRRTDLRSVARAFVWESGRMRNLGTLPGPNSTSDERMSRALAINEHGQIVGESTVLESDAWHSRPV